MKKLLITSMFIIALFFNSCTKDNETILQPYNKIIFQENFDSAVDNTNFDLPNWTNFAQAGTKKFTEQKFRENGYAEFSSFQTGSTEIVNISWLISPEIDMDTQQGEILHFQSAPNFLTSIGNELEVLVSTNYDGTNVAAADWITVPAIVASPAIPRFVFVSSGPVDISRFSGKLHFAFRVTGSGVNQNLDGTFQIDNILVYHKVKE